MQDAIQLQRFGRRMRRGQNFSGHVVFNGPDQSAFSPSRGQNRFHQKRGRAFSVRSRDARYRNSLRRLLVKVRAQPRQSPPTMRHERPGHALARLLRRRIRNHRHRSRLNGAIDKAVAVGSFAAHGHEQASRFDSPRVVFHTTHFRVPALREDFRSIQQMLEGHRSELYGRGVQQGFTGEREDGARPGSLAQQITKVTFPRCFPSATVNPSERIYVHRNQYRKIPLRPVRKIRE
jgi:hypothetical protein